MRVLLIILQLFYILLPSSALSSTILSSELHTGLYFRAHTVIPEERTSLNLTPDKPINLKKGGVLDFEVLLRSEKHNYGYVARIILNDTLNIDLLANKGWNKNQLSLMKGNRQLMNLNDLHTVSHYQEGDWLHVSIEINYEEQKIVWTLNGTKQSVSTNLPQLSSVQIVFGLNNIKSFKSTDVAPMNLRNIKVTTIKGKSLREWSLSKHGEANVYDALENARASIHNGVWEIDQHIKWEKLTSFYLHGTNGRIAPYQKKNDGGIFAILKDTIYTYSISNGELIKTITSSGQPYNSTVSSLIYDSIDNLLISYTPERDIFNSYNFQKNKWELDIPNVFLSYLHQSSCYIPEKKELIAFGGYGFYQYNAILFKHSKDSVGWQKTDFSQTIEPRYMTSMGYWGDGKILLLGGYGSKSGKQEETPKNFYDLHIIDTDQMLSKKLWEFSNDRSEVFGNSIVIGKEKKSFYVLSFDNDRAHSYLKLNQFDITAPNRKLLADSIPFLFHDTESYCTLFYNEATSQFIAALIYQDGAINSKVELYGLKSPAIQIDDVIQNSSDLSSSGSSTNIYINIFILFIILTILISSTLYLKKRNKKKKEFELILYSSDDQVKIQNSSIRLLGGFQVVNTKGVDITTGFTQILRHLFLYMLLYSYKDTNGITSDQLIETFWFGMDKSNAMNNRNVNLSKLRLLLKDIGNININHKNGYWHLTMDTSVSCDYIEMIDLLKKANAEVKSKVPSLLTTLNRISELGQNGELLPDITEEWIDRFKEDYSILLSDILLESIKLPEVKSELMLLLKLAEIILSSDSLDENAIQYKCYALHYLGKKGLSKQCYENFCEEYTRILGTKPEMEYSDIIKRS